MFLFYAFFFFFLQVKIIRLRETMMLWPSGLQILQIQHGWKVSIDERESTNVGGSQF